MIEANKWLEETEALQKEYFNADPRSFRGEERAEYIRTNILAAVAELIEMLDEVTWKPWSSEEPGVIKSKESFISESVDVGHFVANALLAGGATDSEYWSSYNSKMQRNRDRMSKSGGYQASKNKCPKCKRELDAPGAYKHLQQSYVQKESEHVLVNKLECLGCRHEFNYEMAIGDSLPGAGQTIE